MTDDWEFVQPDIVPVTDELYRLDEDYEYRWTKFDTIYRITIPAGFIYDGASVPRIVWTISGITPDGLIRAAALVHDWIYFHAGKLPNGSHQYLNTDAHWSDILGRWRREHADRIFARIMREANVPKSKRRMAYRAVWFFGWFRWKD
jgi:hypothetical protein